MIPTIQPLNGVPPELRRVFDDLLRMLNDRFAGIQGSALKSAISIEDNGGQVKITASVLIDTDSGSYESQLKIKSNRQGALELLNHGPDDLHVLFDCSWDGARLIAKHTSTARVVKNAFLLKIYCAEGQTVDTEVTGEVLAMTVQLHTAGATLIGCVGFGGNTLPTQAVDATGDIEASGVYRVAGQQVVHGRMAGVANPTGGVTVDSQARTAIAQVISRLSFFAGGHGLID